MPPYRSPGVHNRASEFKRPSCGLIAPSFRSAESSFDVEISRNCQCHSSSDRRKRIEQVLVCGLRRESCLESFDFIGRTFAGDIASESLPISVVHTIRHTPINTPGPQYPIDPVADTGCLPRAYTHGRPLLGDVATSEASSGGQTPGDAQRRVTGEGADLKNSLGAGDFDEKF